jgi:hypothetical protein
MRDISLFIVFLNLKKRSLQLFKPLTVVIAPDEYYVSDFHNQNLTSIENLLLFCLQLVVK